MQSRNFEDFRIWSLGNYQSSSTISFDGGVGVTETVQSSGADISASQSAFSSQNNNKVQLIWNIVGADSGAYASGVSETHSSPDSVSLSQTYHVAFATESQFKASASNIKGYKAEASADVINGGFNTFSNKPPPPIAKSQPSRISTMYGETRLRGLYRLTMAL
jgi:hypothetical protein